MLVKLTLLITEDSIGVQDSNWQQKEHRFEVRNMIAIFSLRHF